MMKSFVIKLSSALVLMLYVLSFVGISIHTCSCTGSVCVSIAFHQHHEHGAAGHHHDSCCGHHHDGCASCLDEQRHEAHHCCHNTVLRLSLAGEDNHAHDIQLQAPLSDVTFADIPYIVCYGAHHCSCHQLLNLPPPDGDILQSICVMRV